MEIFQIVYFFTIIKFILCKEIIYTMFITQKKNDMVN